MYRWKGEGVQGEGKSTTAFSKVWISSDFSSSRWGGHWENEPAQAYPNYLGLFSDLLHRITILFSVHTCITFKVII